MLRIKDKHEVYKVAINAAMGSFLFGYQLVNISSLERLFRNKNQTTERQTQIIISIITAALPLTAILGAVMLKKIMKKIKARILMVLMDIMTILAILIQDISLAFWCLLLGRLVLGFAVGINSGLVPQYIYSVTPTALAGSVGSLHQVFLMVGVAFGYTLGFLIDPNNTQDKVNWRILISFPIITCAIRSILLMTLLPYQIPSSRTKQKQIQRLQKYYYKIYQYYGGEKDLRDSRDSLGSQIMNSTADLDQQQGSGSSSQKHNLIICIILAFSNQICGINAILFYAKQLFMRITNNNNDLSQLLIIFLGIVQIVATLIGGKLMDKFPKKQFLIGGQFCMTFFLLMIFMLSQNQILVICLIFMHTIAYSFSVGQLLMYYAAKMLQNTGYVIMVNWFVTFLVAITAQFMMKGLGIGKMCLIFAVLLSICLVVLFKSIPSEKQIGDMEQRLIGSQKQIPEPMQLKSTKEMDRSTQGSIQENKQIKNTDYFLV